jgi:hypothetical protein
MVRKSWTKDMFGLDPPTTKDTDFHNLPPDPEDEVKSTVKSSQGPISLAIDTITTGDMTKGGVEIVEFWGSFDFQLEQEGSTLEVHRAFNTPLFNSNRSPKPIDDPIEEISREESLIHTQREEERSMWEIDDEVLKRDPQLITFDTPPRFVEELKITIIWLPSEENSDCRIKGGGNTSSTPLTINISPVGNTALK